MVQFQRDFAELTRVMVGAIEFNEELIEKVAYLKQTIVYTPQANHSLLAKAEVIEKELEDILFKFEGSTPKASDEEIPPRQVPLTNRLQYVIWGQSGSTSSITSTSKLAYEIIQEELPELISMLKKMSTIDIKNLEQELEEIKAPWTPGRIPELN